MSRAALALCSLLGVLGAGRSLAQERAAPRRPDAVVRRPPPRPARAGGAPDRAPPYAPPLPGMRAEQVRSDDQALELLQQAGRTVALGPGQLQARYVDEDRPARSARAICGAYRGALLAAGWQVEALAPGPTALLAQHVQRGRALRMTLRCEAKAVRVAIADPAARARAERLRAALAATGRAAVYGVTFEVNKARLRLRESALILQQILAVLVDNAALKLEIQVHSDDSFRDVYGRRPTQDRAQELARWLIAHGVAADRLVAKGYGESVPVASNQTAEGRARNRRIVLLKLP